MKRFPRVLALSALVAVAFGIGAAAPPLEAAPARPAAVSTSYQTCSQSAFVGTRVCVDVTPNGIPGTVIAYVFTSGTAVFAQFQVCVSWNVGTGFMATPIEYTPSAVNGVATGAVAINPVFLPGPAFNQLTTCGNAGNLDLLRWFGNDPSYEFVVAA